MKQVKTPSLNDLRAFEAVARLGTVRAAANEIAVTHGAVSRRIRNLADYIEVQLFQVEGRGICLTSQGEVLAGAVTDAFELIQEALTEIQAPEQAGPILLSCERSVAMRWLMPRLSDFQTQYPEADLHLSFGGGELDFTKDKASIALRRLDFAIDPHYQVDVLMREKMGPVMTPSMLEAFESGDYIGLGSKTRPEAWRDWLAKHPDVPKPKEVRYFDHHFFMVEGAASGLGVALCPKVIAFDYVQDGRLVDLYGFKEDGTEYGLIYPKSMKMNEFTLALKSWLSQNAAEIDKF